MVAVEAERPAKRAVLCDERAFAELVGRYWKGANLVKS